MAEALDAFWPATRAWFTESFAAPTEVQRGAWQAIARGDHALVVAPTGSGKTLAAFLWAIDRLHHERLEQPVAALVEQLSDAASGIAEGVGRLPGVEVLNDVVFTQVCIALEDDAATEALSERLWDEGEVLAMTSRWHDRAVVRFSVSNWQTDAAQVRRTVEAVARALAEVRAGVR